jgi:predicted acylesterase/phospholipase RssA
MTNARDQKQAVVLSGGGAYGAYEVGVLKALLTGQRAQSGSAEIDPDVYTGTSVGAVNAAVMVSQRGMDVPVSEAVKFLEDAWLNLIADSPQTCGNGAFRFRGDLLKYLNPHCLANPAQSFAELNRDGAYLAQDLLRRGLNFFHAPGSVETRALEFVDLSAFVSSEPLSQLVSRIISLEALRRSDKALRVVAANWATGEVRVFENKDMTDEDGNHAILGSAAIPGFFQPQYIAGQPYVDGGVVMNTPLKCALQAGATILHVIYLDPDIENLPLKVLQNTYNTLDRTIVINTATITNEDIDTAAWINEGLEAVERALRGEMLSDKNMLDFIRVAGQIERSLKQGKSYSKVTIHRYHPHHDLGGGGLGILNFNHDRMVGLIDRGFSDTVNHDCEESHCVLPSSSRGSRF